MNVVFLSLGGNLSPRSAYLLKSKAAIERYCGHIMAESPVYQTEAWGSDSVKKYLNQVVQLNTNLTALALMQQLGEIEASLGRVRGSERNADRTVDLDILFFNHDIYNEHDLQIPHPRLHLRKFVLIPLHTLVPEFVHPVLKKNIDTLLRENNDTLSVELFKNKDE